jgi:hypothetical protein
MVGSNSAFECACGETFAGPGMINYTKVSDWQGLCGKVPQDIAACSLSQIFLSQLPEFFRS